MGVIAPSGYVGLPSDLNWVNGNLDWLLYRLDSWKMNPSRPLPFGIYLGSTLDMFISSDKV